MMRTTTACVALAMICIVAAQEPFDVVPETLVQELNQDSEALDITHECFEKTCGPSGCSLAKMDCGEEAKAPWAVFVDRSDGKTTHRPIHSKDLPDGILPVKTLEKPLDLNKAVVMPGMPAEASPKLLAAMKKADKLLAKITKLEKKELKNDPLHKEDRGDLLKLISSLTHMPAGPEKLKSTLLVFKLAKGMAQEEEKEQKKLDQGKKVDTDGTIDDLLPPDDTDDASATEDASPADGTDSSTNDAAAEADIAAGAMGGQMNPADAAKALANMSGDQKKALMKAIVKMMVRKQEKQKGHMTKQEKKETADTITHMLAPMMGGTMPVQSATQADGTPREKINGIPVGHQKCYMRACVHKVIDPATQKVSCGAAVISCGVNGKKPKDTRKLSKKAALDLAKHSMGPFFPGAKGFGGLQLHGAPSDMVVEMELP